MLSVINKEENAEEIVSDKTPIKRIIKKSPGFLVEYDCDCCGKSNTMSKHNFDKNKKHFCGDVCFRKYNTRENHPSFKNGYFVCSEGYKKIYLPKHPNCDSHGYINEHRIIMEKQIGRYLSGKEVIHHLNEDKLDNHIENLVLCKNQKEHLLKYHNRNGLSSIGPISVYIPVRDRSPSQITRCVNYIKKNNGGLVREINIIDYGSKFPVRIKNKGGVNIIRVEADTWNKAHALNLSIVNGNSPFICTLDVDMLLDFKHFSEIITNLQENNFIVSTNVRRIKKKDISKDYNDMISKATSWFPESRNQLFNQANGGFQVYPRTFFDKIGGIMEGMGKYHRAVDNWVFYMARMNGLNTIDISYPLLHIEHDKQKEEHYTEEIRTEAQAYAGYKAWYIDFMIKMGIKNNPEPFYGKDKPCEELYNKFLEEIKNKDKKVQEAASKRESHVTIAGQTFHINYPKKSIIICVINNSGLLPSYFVWDLFRLYYYTLRGYDVEITQINACSIEQMRNLAVKYALGQNPQGKKYDYLVQLDDDHNYNEKFITKFLKIMQEKNWPILTGLTAGKKPPYKNTQYYKWMLPMDTKGNNVNPSKCKQKIQVAASGPVGMIIDTRIFKNIPFPWYSTKYSKVKINGEQQDAILGSDLHFCELLGKYNIPIMLDRDTTFPHHKEFCLNRGMILPVQSVTSE